MAMHPVEAISAVEASLTAPDTDGTVEMTVARVGTDRYRAVSHFGASEFVRVRQLDAEGVERYRYTTTFVDGIDPIEDGDLGRFATLAEELDELHPSALTNSFPHAHDHIAQFFDSPHAPDVLVLNASTHQASGNSGQHGSLGIVQARAPFIVGGAGVRRLGWVDGSARMVDVAPTVAALCGVQPAHAAAGPTGAPRPGAMMARQDGDVLINLLDGSPARHVVTVLLDGCNANVLRDELDAGNLPRIASVLQEGAGLSGGLIASLPTVTLANHTTAMTGAHPGHSGVINNMWLDRETSSTPDLLDLSQMMHASESILPDVETLFEALTRSVENATSSAHFEFCDRGASYSTFGEMRAGTLPPLPPASELVCNQQFAESSSAYSFGSSVDELAISTALECWEQLHRHAPRSLTSMSFCVTDEAGHDAGPHSPMTREAIRDCDRRIGQLLDLIDSLGHLHHTAVVIFADHGMQLSSPEHTATRSGAVARAAQQLAENFTLRDVSEGLVYLSDTATSPSHVK